MKYYVYKHTFNNGTVYFGKGIGNRINSIKRNRHWVNLYKKYGEPCKEFLNTNISEGMAFQLECAYISVSRSCGIKDCNMTVGGEGVSGYTHTLEIKTQISNTLKGVQKSEDTRRKMSESQKRRYKGNPSYNISIYDHRKVVQQYTKTGEFVREYNSITEASVYTGINKGNISTVCQMKLHTAGGYSWKLKSK